MSTLNPAVPDSPDNFKRVDTMTSSYITDYDSVGNEKEIYDLSRIHVDDRIKERFEAFLQVYEPATMNNITRLSPRGNKTLATIMDH